MRARIAGTGIAVVAAIVLLGAQGLTGVQANWKDLETWTHYLEDSRENELGLGLQTGASNGAVPIAFLGRSSVRDPRTAPTNVRVQVAAGVLASPNLVRRPTLEFVADAGTDKRVRFDLTSRLTVDDPTPGGNIQNGIAIMRAADFMRLTRAERLAANVFGFDTTFTPEQIKAMGAFAEKLHLTNAAARDGGR